MTGHAAKDGPSRYRIEALARGLRVLRLFDDTTVSLRTSEIATRTGISMPTTFRIVSTLEELGFLERGRDGSVQPGLAVFTLGAAAMRGSSLVHLSDRPLRELAETTGHTVNLGVLADDRVLYLARLRNADLVTANVHVGSTLPAPYTSMGKLLLAHLPEAELARRITAASFPPGAGRNAVRDLDELRPQLDRIRAAGYAVQDEEMAQGLRSISAPVRDGGGQPVAAVNVAVSAASVAREELEGPVLRALLVAVADIGVRLGSS
jgi:IclR family transcriptional regulator, pca regulon regulatory protein